MSTKKSGKTEFENYFKHLKKYHPYQLSGDDFVKQMEEEKNNDSSSATPISGMLQKTPVLNKILFIFVLF